LSTGAASVFARDFLAATVEPTAFEAVIVDFLETFGRSLTGGIVETAKALETVATVELADPAGAAGAGPSETSANVSDAAGVCSKAAGTAGAATAHTGSFEDLAVLNGITDRMPDFARSCTGFSPTICFSSLAAVAGLSFRAAFPPDF